MDPSHIWNVIYNARKSNLEPDQILRRQCNMHVMIDPHHIWNIIYNVRSKQSYPPTSPNTAPATKSLSSRLVLKLRGMLLPKNKRFDDIPTVIRPQNRHLAPATLATCLIRSWRRFCIEKNTAFRAPAICENVTKMQHRPRKVTVHRHKILRLPQKFRLHLHHLLQLPRKMHSTAFYTSILSWHLFSPGIYYLWASIL